MLRGLEKWGVRGHDEIHVISIMGLLEGLSMYFAEMLWRRFNNPACAVIRVHRLKTPNHSLRLLLHDASTVGTIHVTLIYYTVNVILLQIGVSAKLSATCLPHLSFVYSGLQPFESSLVTNFCDSPA